MRNTKPLLCLQPPASERSREPRLFTWSPRSERRTSCTCLRCLSQPPVLSPLSLSHQFTDIQTHTQAGARSSTRRRAHAHCAHCSAAADVWWPKGSEPFQKNVIQIHTIVRCPPEASKSQMDNIWTSFFFFFFLSFSFNIKKPDCILKAKR